MAERHPQLDIAPYTLDLTGVEGPLSWREVFGKDRPVELEVGSGKGLFLQNAALANPDHHFVGTEISRKYAKKVAERAAKKNLSNIKVYSGDARQFLARFVPDSSLQTVHVYFPDPWWKARHKKRRIFCEALVVDIERVLVNMGRLCVATDVMEYCVVIKALIAEHPRFLLLPNPVPRDAEHELDYLTNFERKYRIEGRPICRLHYVLNRSPVDDARLPL
ncbi:MAG: tRNA (guanosine(46)-N7)-methyltransferase TrmB [Isosphaeraceae bacterium]